MLESKNTMELPRVAAVQMVSGNDIDQNLREAEALIRNASERGASFIVLPENFAVFDMDLQRAVGRQEAGSERPVRRFLSRCARQYSCWLLGGTIPICDKGGESRPFSASLLFDSQGEELARYNKIHLFDVSVKDSQGSYQESKTYCPGEAVVTVPTPFGRLGLAVCYDLRFPELFRLMFQDGVDILALPSAFTYATGAAHWMPLLRARAIENTCYIVAANQGGRHSLKRETYGHSVIISPWGEVLDCIGSGPGIAIAPFDKSTVEDQRKNMPTGEHQRFFVNRAFRSDS